MHSALPSGLHLTRVTYVPCPSLLSTALSQPSITLGSQCLIPEASDDISCLQIMHLLLDAKPRPRDPKMLSTLLLGQTTHAGQGTSCSRAKTIMHCSYFPKDFRTVFQTPEHPPPTAIDCRAINISKCVFDIIKKLQSVWAELVAHASKTEEKWPDSSLFWLPTRKEF